MPCFSVCYDSFVPVWSLCAPVVTTWWSCEPVVTVMDRHQAIWMPSPELEALARRPLFLSASSDDQFDTLLAQLLVLLQKYATPENIAWVVGLLVKLLQSNSDGVSTTGLLALNELLPKVHSYVGYHPWARYHVQLLDRLVSDALDDHRY